MTLDERRQYALYVRELPNGRIADVLPTLTRGARLCLVDARDPYSYETVW